MVIPALNEAVNLRRVLALLRPQQDAAPTVEVIVVDNASSDGTAEVATSLGATVVTEGRRGKSRARNRGIRASTGGVVAFLDADCVPRADWLARLLAPFDDPTVGCVAGEIVNAGAEHPLGRYLSAKGHLAQRVTFQNAFLPYAQTGNVAFRRAVIDAIGLFDETLEEGEDADYCWRMQLETGFKIVLAPDAIVSHSDDLSPGPLLRQKRRHARGAVLLYKKYARRGHPPAPDFKHTYWEYQSILRRGLRFAAAAAGCRLGLCGGPPPEQGYQLLIEVGEKLGRLEGSFRHRVWWP